MRKTTGFVLIAFTTVAAAAQTSEITMHRRQSGSFEHLEPEGWLTRIAETPQKGIRFIMTPDNSNTVALILSTALSPTAAPVRLGVETILSKAGSSQTPLSWDNGNSAGAEFQFTGARSGSLYGRAVCSQRNEGGQIRNTCGILNAATPSAFAATLSLKQILSVVQSVHSTATQAPGLAGPAPHISQTAAAPALIPNAPSIPLGKWSTSESSPAYVRYIQGGNLDFGGSGETLFLELGGKNSFRFVQAYTTTGPYFAGISIRDERGTFTVSGSTLTFHHRSCTTIVRSANNPLERSDCGDNDRLTTLEIEPATDGQSMKITGKNISFMGRKIERWTLHRVK